MKVLVAVADDSCRNQVLNYLKSRKWTDKTTTTTTFRILHVLDIDKPSDGRSATQIHQRQRDAVFLLEKFAFELRCAHPGTLIEKSMVEGDARDQILVAAREWHADLIVIGAHGRKWLERLLLGSVSQGVTSDSPCSVAVVKFSDSVLDVDLTESDLPQQVCSFDMSEHR